MSEVLKTPFSTNLNPGLHIPTTPIRQWKRQTITAQYVKTLNCMLNNYKSAHTTGNRRYQREVKFAKKKIREIKNLSFLTIKWVIKIFRFNSNRCA